MKILLISIIVPMLVSCKPKSVEGWKIDVGMKLCNGEISYYDPHWFTPDIVVCKGSGYYEIYGTMKDNNE